KGWYTDEALTIEAVAGATITTNTTLYAKWKINTYIVEFEVLDGTYIAPQTVEYNTAATKPSTDPERNGYRFIGWYTSDDYSQLYDFDSLVTSNIIIYAKWVEDASQVVNTYDVTLVFNNGEENEVCNVKENTVFGTPTEPTKTGYTFVGWYSDVSLSTAYDFSTTVTSDITLYAKWNINTYTV
ncbi:MAG: InlB B-repeat-containing protein, partial [Anaeroplasmataceae bacterium]